jgi:phosphate transport system substrate-binding protein
MRVALRSTELNRKEAILLPLRKIVSTRGALLMACSVGLASLLVGAPARITGTINIIETGSSLLYPLFNLWVPVFTQTHPNIKITTQSTGSGTGISQAVEGIVQIGASDAYMSNALTKQHPDVLNIPLAISMQMVNYNLPRLNHQHLKLSGPVLADIYSGKVTKWDDREIASLNPGVNLPNHQIITVHRTDGSGDTFIFTQYLSFSTSSWQNSVGYGTTVSWPALSGSLGAVGNPGMITATQGNPYSIAYIGCSYEDAIHKAALGTATLKNRDGNFVLPSAKTATAAASEMVSKTPANERVSLIFAPGSDSYPIINYEYVIVNRKQGSAETAAALREFFTWAISPDGGSAPHFISKLNFISLPAPIAKLSQAQIAEIQ